jgi:hypothetical protein
MSDIRSLWKNAAGLALVFLRSFVVTLLVVLAAGVLLAAASAYLLWDYPVYASVTAACAVAESLATGVLLGGKRAVVMALAHGLRSLKLGRAVVGLVFEHALGVSSDQTVGDRGGTLTRAVERLPLAQAERRLTSAVSQLLGEPHGGWLRRRLQARLLRAVQRYTLARFREDGARHGGVDLARVQTELEATVDDRLTARLRHGLNLWTLLVLFGLPAAVFAQTYILLALLHAK